MTASYAKPFDALAFIRANKIKGKMYNYWTEGGFIAWGQYPDPKTGKTPLQLFMDGRAQAAYEPEAYDRWMGIMSAGPVAYKARQLAKRNPTTKEYEQIGKWVSKQLRDHDVWVMLMPAMQFNKDIVRGTEHNPDWKLIFINNKQKLFVDGKTKEGEKLYKGIFDKTTIYQDEFSRLLTLSHHLLNAKDPNALKIGLACAMEALRLVPSRMPMIRILNAARRGMKKPVDEFCKGFFMDFAENKNTYEKQNGYIRRLMAAMLAGDYLYRNHLAVFKNTGSEEDKRLATFYLSKLNGFNEEAKIVTSRQRW